MIHILCGETRHFIKDSAMVPCKVITVISFLFSLLGQRSCQGSDKQSRLLVSDPTYLLSQLESLTQEVNKLKTVSSQENQALKSKLDDQNTEIASLRSQISSLTQKVNAQGIWLFFRLEKIFMRIVQILWNAKLMWFQEILCSCCNQHFMVLHSDFLWPESSKPEAIS